MAISVVATWFAVSAFPQNVGDISIGTVGALGYWAADAITSRYLRVPGHGSAETFRSAQPFTNDGGGIGWTGRACR